MTRINVGVAPLELSRQHLLAEHREIKRIPNTIKSGKAVLRNIPQKFTLGSGHVKFFYDKLGYLKKRYLEIRDECFRRGYNVTDYSACFDGIPTELMGQYEPTAEDRKIILNRIAERNGKSLISVSVRH